MKKIIYLAIISISLLSLNYNAFAKKDVESLSSCNSIQCFKAEIPNLKKTYFWEIEKDQRKSYLLGTIHKGVHSLELPAAVFKALNLSSFYLVESDFNKDFPLYDLLSLPINSWKHRLNDKSLKKIAENSEFFPIRSNWRANFISPYGAFLIYSYSKFYQRLGLLDFEMDLQLFEYSQLLGKTIYSLEITEDGFGISKNIDYIPLLESFIDFTSKLIISLKKEGVSYEKWEEVEALHSQLLFYEMLKEYKSGNLEDFFHLESNKEIIDLTLSHFDPNLKKFFKKIILEKHEIDNLSNDALLEQRNVHWVENIDKLHRKSKQGVFVVGGVAHFLLTESNVVNLLRNKGFKVRRVDLNGHSSCLKIKMKIEESIKLMERRTHISASPLKEIEREDESFYENFKYCPNSLNTFINNNFYLQLAKKDLNFFKEQMKANNSFSEKSSSYISSPLVDAIISKNFEAILFLVNDLNIDTTHITGKSIPSSNPDLSSWVKGIIRYINLWRVQGQKLNHRVLKNIYNKNNF